jgi:alanine dehydrogenase
VIVGIPKATKPDEHRTGLTPAGVQALVARGHEVVVQAKAGEGSGIPDAEYKTHGARITSDAGSLFEEAQLILCVNEPQASEMDLLGPQHVVFGYLHLAAKPELTKELCATGATCVAYETVSDEHGRLPLLAPMSEIAGKLAVQVGAFLLQRPRGGRGVLLGGVPGVAAATVMIIGGGVVGRNAGSIAARLGADVFVLDRNIDRLRELDVQFRGRASTVYSSTLAVEEMLPRADLVIGAVLVHGARTTRLITRDRLGLMKRRAVIVDVSIDQGGCCETSAPTTHSDPVYEVDGVTHYCVPNMPGAVPGTSTVALTQAALPYVVAVADQGLVGAIDRQPGLDRGVNVAAGKVTHPAVAAAVGMSRLSLGAAV